MRATSYLPPIAGYRTAGWYAIISGLLAVTGLFLLVKLLVIGAAGPYSPMGRLHYVICAIQYLVQTFFVFAFFSLQQKITHYGRVPVHIMGMAATLLTSLSLLLAFPRIVSDIFYMVPQGIFGVWLISVNLRRRENVSRGLQALGVIAGIGLLVEGVFPVAFGIFVSMDALRIPAVALREYPENFANHFLHQMLMAAFITGVVMLPLWLVIYGIGLVRMGTAVRG
ncbi:hypothetical protein [Puia sp.]|uniref:hypothetical protein n=1 Tax=Puia sp. TaxID=2045100 RepID=UPI002F3F6FBA